MVSFEPSKNGLPKHQTTKWLFRHQLGRKTSLLEHIHKYPQFVAGERAGGKVRKKFKIPPEAPDAPEPPVLQIVIAIVMNGIALPVASGYCYPDTI